MLQRFESVSSCGFPRISPFLPIWYILTSLFTRLLVPRVAVITGGSLSYPHLIDTSSIRFPSNILLICGLLYLPLLVNLTVLHYALNLERIP